jgi:hypothetical protein
MTYKNGKMAGKSLHNRCRLPFACPAALPACRYTYRLPLCPACRYRLPPAVLPLTLPPAVTLPYLCRFACLPAAFIACPCA